MSTIVVPPDKSILAKAVAFLERNPALVRVLADTPPDASVNLHKVIGAMGVYQRASDLLNVSRRYVGIHSHIKSLCQSLYYMQPQTPLAVSDFTLTKYACKKGTTVYHKLFAHNLNKHVKDKGLRPATLLEFLIWEALAGETCTDSVVCACLIVDVQLMPIRTCQSPQLFHEVFLQLLDFSSMGSLDNTEPTILMVSDKVPPLHCLKW